MDDCLRFTLVCCDGETCWKKVLFKEGMAPAGQGGIRHGDTIECDSYFTLCRWLRHIVSRTADCWNMASVALQADLLLLRESRNTQVPF